MKQSDFSTLKSITKRPVFLAAALAVAVCACAPEANEDDLFTEDLVARLTSPLPNQYIVVLNDGITALANDNAIDSLARAHGGQVFFRYHHALNGFAVRMSDSDAQRLARDPRVQFVEEDGVVTAIATQSPATWGLDRIDQRNLPLNNSYTYGSSGSGVHAYVIDTGINAGHNEFSGRVGAGRDLVDNDSNPNDCHGHGTHVAGTVGGTTYGVAKNVILHGVRVLNCQGSGTTSGVVAGIDWVTANASLPAVANMSLGGGGSSAIDNAVRNSISAGVSYAVAAGNDNADACGGSPARVAEAMTAGSTTSSDSRSSFSNYGSCVDVFAPGSSITSAWIGSSGATKTISGTSMASPHVAGVLALYMGDHPSSSPANAFSAVVGAATEGCIASAGSGSPNLLAHSNLGATDPGPHCGGGGEPPGDDPNSCVQTSSCGGRAPGGCYCDFWCAFYGDCCSDGPC